MIITNVALDGMGMAVTLTLLAGALLSNQMAEKRGRFFVLLLVLTCLQHLCDAVNWLCEGKPEWSALLFWVNFVIFTCAPVTSLMFYHYVLSLTHLPHQWLPRLSGILLALCFVWLGMNVINIPTNMFYGVDEAGCYYRGPAYLLFHVYHFSVMMLGTGLAMLDGKISRRHKLALFTYAFLPFVALVFQLMFYGLSSLTYCALTLSMLLIYITVHLSSVAQLEQTGAELRKTRIAYQETLTDAETDDLTGLLVRKVLIRQAEEKLASGRDGGCALWMVDVDRFKQANDQFGHAMGDQVLITVAERLAELFPEGTPVARFGGDEFCVFQCDVTREDVYKYLHRALKDLDFVCKSAQHTLQISISIGVAFAAGDRQVSYEELFQQADEALYVSKNNGRQQYSLREL